MKSIITGEQVLDLGIVLAIGGTILSLIHLILWLWMPMPEITIKIGGTAVISGILLMLIGAFVPNNY